jgi:hypothetical protein
MTSIHSTSNERKIQHDHHPQCGRHRTLEAHQHRPTVNIATPVNWSGSGVTVGASCAGAPSGSFVSTLGVVGHC